MLQNLFEFGSNANVFLKAICDFDKYKKDDVLLYLENVGVNFNFQNKETKITNKLNNLISYNLRDLVSLELTSVGLTNELLELLHISTDKSTSIVRRDVWEKDSTNTCFLLHTPIKKTIKVYPETAFNYNEENNSVIINPLENVDEYVIYYSENIETLSFDLKDEANLPYLYMEIQFQGNIDKNSGNAMLIIPKVNLLDRLDINVKYNSISDMSLSFTVIKDEDYSPSLKIW